GAPRHGAAACRPGSRAGRRVATGWPGTEGRMTDSDAWLLVLAAGVAMLTLRWLPVLLLRLRDHDLPASLARVLECGGVATLGGILALAAFRLSPTGAAPPALEVAKKLVALGLAFVLFLWLRRATLCLILTYGAYVLFTLVMK